MTRRRIDAELVRRGLARPGSRRTSCSPPAGSSSTGRVASKAATQVEPDGEPGGPATSTTARRTSPAARTSCSARSTRSPPASTSTGRLASTPARRTGGFTDVLLRGGAAHVLAVDVGYGQLAWPLRTDERVTVLERTNVREPDRGPAGVPADLVVADLSFISLALVLRAAGGRARRRTPTCVLMVKPQFEVGRERVGRRRRRARPRSCARRRSGPSPRAGVAARARRPRRGGEPAARPAWQRGVLPVAAARRSRR